MQKRKKRYTRNRRDLLPIGNGVGWERVERREERERGSKKQEVTRHRIDLFQYLSLLKPVMKEEKRIQNIEKGISERWDNFKWPNIEVIRVFEGKKD